MRRIAEIVELRAAPELHLLPIDRGSKPGQLAVEHHGAIDLAIAGGAKND